MQTRQHRLRFLIRKSYICIQKSSDYFGGFLYTKRVLCGTVMLMKSSRLERLLSIAALFLGLLSPAFASASSEVHITRDGVAIVDEISVFQVAGSTFFARLTWGNAFVRMNVRATAATLANAYGEPIVLADIKEGHLLHVEGTLESGTDSLTVVAKKLVDLSIRKQQQTFSGSIQNINPGAGTFTLSDPKEGDIVVTVGSSATITKGSRTIPVSLLKNTDRAVEASGEYDHNAKTLKLSAATLSFNKALYVPQNFVGIFKGAPDSKSVPTTIKVQIEGVLYDVHLAAGAQVLTSLRKPTTFTRWLEGDSIRLYGTREEREEPVIDAEVVRNTNL